MVSATSSSQMWTRSASGSSTPKQSGLAAPVRVAARVVAGVPESALDLPARLGRRPPQRLQDQLPFPAVGGRAADAVDVAAPPDDLVLELLDAPFGGLGVRARQQAAHRRT
jgi:hypothetical protein